MQDTMRSRPVSLYLHFPFCVRKCRYCDFLSGPATEETIEKYVKLLCREIELRAAELNELPQLRFTDLNDSIPHRATETNTPPAPVPAQGRPIDTIFIGGGTPSLMTPAQMNMVMQALRKSFRVEEGAEISMEMNPGTADREKLLAFRRAGINRLSIGVQSFDDGELKLLGRIHTADQAREIFREARAAGFDNINIDLMSALPGQKIATWEKTLREAVELGPEHISAYSLIIEEGTPFATMKLPDLPSEDEDREMYHFTKKFLAENGYRRYEISNYAREGFECRHNCGYWTGHEYLGLGLGASSDMGSRFPCRLSVRQDDDLPSENPADATNPESPEISPYGERFRNPSDMEAYRKAVREGCDPEQMRCERQVMTREDRMEEFMFLGLRMADGVSEDEFEARFGEKPEDRYGPVLEKHLAQGVIRRANRRIALTEFGMDVANYVMADYLL